MSLEDDLHNVRPALDRVMNQAAAVERTARRPAVGKSRTRVAVAAFAVAAAIAATVGVVAALDTGGGHGGGVTTRDTGSTTSLDASTTSSTPIPTTTSTTTAPTTTPVTTGVDLQSVDWAAVDYPMSPHCGTAFNPPVSVGPISYATPAPGVQVAVVMVRCTVGAGTPPVAVYVFDRAASATSPHLAATLVADSDEWQASRFSISGATISLPVYGFSSTSIANCCPDVHATLTWQWSAGGYQLTSTVPAHLDSRELGAGF